MSRQPSGERSHLTVRQQINDVVGFEIDQNSPVSLTTPPCPVVNAEDAWRLVRMIREIREIRLLSEFLLERAVCQWSPPDQQLAYGPS